MNKEKWIAYAKEQGFESFEIYQEVSEERSLSWYGGQMDSFVTSHVNGTSLRGIIDGNMAMLATEDAGDELMEELIGKMIDQSKVITTEDKGVIREPQKTDEVVSQRKFIRPESSDILDLFRETEKKILSYDERVLQVSFIEWGETSRRREITNSYGMEVKDGDRIQVMVAGVVVKQGDEVKDSYDFEIVEDLSSFDTEKFVKELCDKALNKLGADSLESGTYKVIMEKGAMSSLFAAFSQMFSGELIGKGLSPLNDSLGKKIFSEKITVIDDPRYTEAVTTANYDDEGCPTRRKTIVDRGVFEMMLHNSKSALRLGTESTGNGFKPGYAAAVNVMPKNMYIEKGDKSLDELMAEMGEGLVIESLAGLHAGLDFITTDFSLQCAGYYVKDRKRERSITLITVASNFLKMMKDVTDVGNDLEWKMSSTACPSILFKGLSISGK